MGKQTAFVLENVIRVMRYVAVALGIPGNILSAIVWLRLYVASRNSSVVYLAALAVNDLVYLLCVCFYRYSSLDQVLGGWLMYGADYTLSVAYFFDPLLVLSFSVERLIAILRPLQVCCMRYGMARYTRV